MNRREHSHLCICTQSVTFSRNVYRQSLYMEPVAVSGFEFRRTLPPTFLFLQYSVFKEQTLKQCRGPWRLASGPVECRSRGSLDFYKGELFSRQRRAALVVAVYSRGSVRVSTTNSRFFEFFATTGGTTPKTRFSGPLREIIGLIGVGFQR